MLLHTIVEKYIFATCFMQLKMLFVTILKTKIIANDIFNHTKQATNGVFLLITSCQWTHKGIYDFFKMIDSKHTRCAHENEHIRKPHMMSYAWTQVSFERFVKLVRPFCAKLCHERGA
jgi:hypothetical protein